MVFTGKALRIPAAALVGAPEGRVGAQTGVCALFTMAPGRRAQRPIGTRMGEQNAAQPGDGIHHGHMGGHCDTLQSAVK